jgi:Lon protease-like protein
MAGAIGPTETILDRRPHADQIGSMTIGSRYATTIASMIVIAAPALCRAQSADPVGALTTPVLPATIPIFPLPVVALFPNTEAPFHIFEPRYRDMVADALAGDSLIGLVMLQPGFEADYEGRPPIYSVGCAGVIDRVEQLPDGRYDMVLRAVVKVRIVSEDAGRSYRVAQVEALPETLGEEDRELLSQRRRRLVALVNAEPPSTLSDEEIVNTLAQHFPLDPADRQMLLELEGVLARSESLIRLMEATRSPQGRGGRVTPIGLSRF